MLRKLCLWANHLSHISLLELLIMVWLPRLLQGKERMTLASRKNQELRRKKTNSVDIRIPWVVSSFHFCGINDFLQLAHSAAGGVGFGAGMGCRCHSHFISYLLLKVLLLVEVLFVLFSEHDLYPPSSRFSFRVPSHITFVTISKGTIPV